MKNWTKSNARIAYADENSALGFLLTGYKAYLEAPKRKHQALITSFANYISHITNSDDRYNNLARMVTQSYLFAWITFKLSL